MPRNSGSDGSDTALFGMLRNKLFGGSKSKPASRPARGATTSRPAASRPTTSRSSMSEPVPRMTAAERKANATRKEPPAPKTAPKSKVSVRPAPSAYADVSPAPKTRPKTSPVAPSSRSSVTVPKPSVDRSVDIPKPSVPAPKPSTPASKPTSMTAPKPKSPTKFGKTGDGDYPTYDRQSKSAESFRSAFARARKEGRETFTWVGADGKSRKYTTELKK